MKKPTAEFIEKIIIDLECGGRFSKSGLCYYLLATSKVKYTYYFKLEYKNQTGSHPPEGRYWFPVNRQTERIEFLKKCIENLNK